EPPPPVSPPGRQPQIVSTQIAIRVYRTISPKLFRARTMGSLAWPPARTRCLEKRYWRPGQVQRHGSALVVKFQSDLEHVIQWPPGELRGRCHMIRGVD